MPNDGTAPVFVRLVIRWSSGQPVYDIHMSVRPLKAAPVSWKPRPG